ncbi:MAG: hypothetical protein FWE39_12580, partial [Nocardiaceae bacterium]|nr:hypothetical protein [Nocardiaceae bacterium]
AAAQYVHLDIAGFEPLDSWFHLAAGDSRSVRLRASGPPAEPRTSVSGRVRALNSLTSAQVTVETRSSRDVHRID